MNAVEVHDFAKGYGGLAAVRGVCVQVRQGELFGLIGPDGAGKTTLLRTLCTLLAPDAGTLRVLGLDVVRQMAQIRARIGYMPQRFSLYHDLSVEQNLRFFADLFGVPSHQRDERLARLYRFSRLEPFRRRRAGALSGGMKQKLALSCALVHTPELLVLDEPTFGVDPVSREEFWDILRLLRQEGTSVLVSTAYMEEADQCDRVALMHLGRIAALGTPAELKGAFPGPLFRVWGPRVRGLHEFFSGLPEVRTTQLFGDRVHVGFRRDPAEADWERWQRASGAQLAGWAQQPPSIEDLFLALTEEAA